MLNKNLLLMIAGIFVVVTLGFTTSYTAPTYNDINFSLCSGYEAPLYNSINFTLGLDDSCVTDTCTYSGTGNWNISLSDYCIITTDTDIGANTLILYGEGNCTIDAIINAEDWIFENATAGSGLFINDNKGIYLGGGA